MITDRAICTVAAFMQGAPVPPPGMAQELIANLYRYYFVKMKFTKMEGITGERI